MFRKLQKYLLENEKKIFLKYDGERKKNKFTIMLIDKTNIDKNICFNTNDIYNKISEIFNQNIFEEVSELIKMFINLKDKCYSFFGKEVVFIFSVEIVGSVEMYASINLKQNNWRYKGKTINDISEFVNKNGREFILNIANEIIDNNIESFRELAK